MRGKWPVIAAPLRALLAVVPLCVVVVTLSRFPFDDAFIHLRIARNLVTAGQPYFNVGERVMADSSPMWLLLESAVVGMFGASPFAPLVVIECAILAWLFIECEALISIGRRSWATWALAAFATATVLAASGGLMESALALALLTQGAIQFRRARWLSCGLLLALAAATRYELAAPCVVAVLVAPGVQARVRTFLGAAAVGAVEVALLLAEFGTVLPNTIAAKSALYQLTFSQLVAGCGGWAVLAVLTVASAIGAAMAVVSLRRHDAPDDRWRAFVASLPVVLLALYVVKKPLLFPWYRPLLWYPLALLLGALILEVQAHRARIAAALLALVLAPQLLGIGTAYYALASGDLAKSDDAAANARVAAYLRTGALLAETCPGASLMTAEIGALGWAFGGRIIDAAGLASPGLIKYHPLRVPEERASGTLGAIPGRAAVELRPSLIVSMEAFATDLANKAESLRDYSLVLQVPLARDAKLGGPVTVWGSSYVSTWARRGRCAVALAGRG